MKLFLYVCLGILALVLLFILKMILKRAVLLAKIKKAAKKSGSKVILQRNRFKSVFFHDLRTDFLLEKNGESFEVSILTTPFKRFRYHFTSPERLKIVMLKKGVFLTNPRTLNSAVAIEGAFNFWRYKIAISPSETPPERRILLIHPSPRDLLVTTGTKIETPSNGEILYGAFMICFGKYFRENIL